MSNRVVLANNISPELRKKLVRTNGIWRRNPCVWLAMPWAVWTRWTTLASQGQEIHLQSKPWWPQEQHVLHRAHMIRILERGHQNQLRKDLERQLRSAGYLVPSGTHLKDNGGLPQGASRPMTWVKFSLTARTPPTRCLVTYKKVRGRWSVQMGRLHGILCSPQWTSR